MGRNSGADLFVESLAVLNSNALSPLALSKTEALDFFRDQAGRDSTRHTSKMPAEIRRSYAPHRHEADRLRLPSDDHL